MPRRLLLLALLALARPAVAQPSRPPAAPSPRPPVAAAPRAPAPSAPRPLRPAIARVVDELARSLDGATGRALVAAAPLVSDAPAPRGAQLTAALAAHLAGKLGAGARPQRDPLALPLAREAARSEGALVHLAVEIAAGRLRVTADVYPVPGTVWARLRDPEPGPIAHAYAEAPLDAEIRSFLAPIPLVAAKVDRARNFEGDVVALACGDLDADGSLELLSVSRRRVTTLRLRGGRVAPLQSRAWPDIVGVHPSPLREPIAFATLVEREQGGELLPPFADVGLTDRARSVRFDGALQPVAELPGLAVPDGGGSACTTAWGPLLTGPLGPCAPADPRPATPALRGRYDALASARLLSPRGEPFTVWATRERGEVELRDSAGRRGVVGNAGAQLAVGDLDQDGEPELLASLDVLNPLEDAVVVWSWRRRQGAPDRAAPAEVLRLPAPAGVRALAVCPPDGAGRAPFAVATADEIWVVR
ncbi:hypothetical protein SOCEGT47_066310 [Sorangium cellulosum]|uniref:VCBS repeat-containing protein n=1 Tax=Sorangium cellulosum TaxID=56 RepID=A0A4P2Q9Z3_SORCE|nr:hypothetical protein [Sorangium cellulosum]AUX26076.1 hypothetical protein SOCEGT47_066310 [Sorangium cellulosum]